MLVIKENVIITGLNSRMQPAIDKCLEIYNDVNTDLVITSAHRPWDKKSKHAKGDAFDIRIRQFTPAEQNEIHAILVNELGTYYDVIIKRNPPHIHIEWEPK